MHGCRRREEADLLNSTGLRLLRSAAAAEFCGRLLLLAALAFGCWSHASPAASRAARPNLLIFLADDLGFSDLGCYGGEIATPNLDALAANGLRFTQFYNTARCWPTRAAILTGYYAQAIRRDTVLGVRSGAGGTRPAWAQLLPRMLQPLGYRSFHSGKWHVDGTPLTGGFDRSYRLDDGGRYFNPTAHFLDDQRLPAVKREDGYYSTIAIADRAIEFLKDHQSHHGGEPFFGYVCFTAPHFPLHALPEDIAKYRDRYRVGWDVIRRQRWERAKKLGIVRHNLSPVERDVGPPYDFPEALKKLGQGETNRPVPWTELSDAQREFQATKMAIHAAMTGRMDREIGRVLDQLRAMGAMSNTLILFLSDNGASAEIMVRDDGHDPDAVPGSAGTHLCLGPGWSSAANSPLRRHKTWVHEGGIATPLIVHWPAGIKARGQLRHTPGHVVDIAPTFLELAGGQWPAQLGEVAVPPNHGISIRGFFSGDRNLRRDSIWWAHEGNRAVRVGNWKLVAAKKGSTQGAWELYDLSRDRTETKNLAAQRPARVRELDLEWQRCTDEFSALAVQAKD